MSVVLDTDMRLKEPVNHSSSVTDVDRFDADEDGGVSGGIDTVTTDISDQLDPSRLPPAQRQLYMRIQQKQHRDDINNKPISELTAKRAYLFHHSCSTCPKRTLFWTKSARTLPHFTMRTHFTFFKI